MDVNRKGEIEDDLDTPFYPARTFLAHVSLKAIQAGSCFGVAITPVVALLYRRSLGDALKTSVNRSAFFAFIITSGMLAAQTYTGKFDAAGVDDRAYRLAHNKGQLEVDSWSRQGAAAGLAYAALRGHARPRTLVAYSLTGVALSVYAYGAAKFFESPKGKRFAKDIGEIAEPFYKTAGKSDAK